VNKILFLDIDGVLNTCENQAIDNEKLSYIRYLISKGVDIVISSSWRRHKTRAELCDFLNIPIRGVTPIGRETVRRGFEINQWLHDNDDPMYCIIDDNSDIMSYQADSFVKTDSEKGMEFHHLEKICKILVIDVPSKKQLKVGT
jgi:hydroxymethylpyrimidine pyrophosphatase-like HAD family hydrolase